VECYDPVLDTWTPDSEMSVCRSDVSIGVMDGVMYAVGGFDGTVFLKSVEVYSLGDKCWSMITDMHLPRSKPGD